VMKLDGNSPFEAEESQVSTLRGRVICTAGAGAKLNPGDFPQLSKLIDRLGETAGAVVPG